MAANQFALAEQEFAKTRALFDAGQITQEQLDAKLRDLMVQDGQGRYWILGADTGKWYYHDGSKWLVGNPNPGATPAGAVADASTGSPTVIAPPPGTPPAPRSAAPSQPAAPPNRTPLFVAFIVLVLLLLLAGGLYYLYQTGMFAPPGSRSATISPTVDTVAGIVVTPSPLPTSTVALAGLPAVTETSLPSPAPSEPPVAPTSACPPEPLPQALRVEPVQSPTGLETQEISVSIEHAQEISIQSEAGTAEWNEGGDSASPAVIEIALLPGTTHHLTVTARVEYSADCVYTVQTQNDVQGAPLVIVTSVEPTPEPLPTDLPTDTPTLVVRATATPVRPTRTPAPQLPPGIYVTRIVVDPSAPRAKGEIRFTATLVNTSGSPQGYRFLVQLYDPEIQRSNKRFGESNLLSITAAPGESVYTVTYGGTGPVNECKAFYAQAEFQNQDKSRTPFQDGQGKIVQANFRVCPS